MKLPAALRAPLGIDPLRTAGAFGAFAGVASLAVPYFLGLTEALAAVGVVAWAGRLARSRNLGVPSGLAAAAVAGAGVYGLLAAPPWSIARGALLGLGTAALAAAAGRRPPFEEDGG